MPLCLITPIHISPPYFAFCVSIYIKRKKGQKVSPGSLESITNRKRLQNLAHDVWIASKPKETISNKGFRGLKRVAKRPHKEIVY